MITSLITALRANDIEPIAEELADALWFAIQIKPFVAPVTVSKKISPSPQSEPVDSPVPNIQAQESPISTDIFEKPLKPEPLPTSIETQESYPVVPKTDKQTGSKVARPIRVPAATMLPGILSLERALRPLKRLVESRTRYVLDEAATVRRIAEQDIWLPVSKGVAERWFEVVLVIDQSASMVIWQPTIGEWCNLLQRHGAFRNVRSFAMKYEGQRVQLYTGSRSCSPRELLNSSGRRLILIVSDCVSPAWYSGAITRLLELWGQSNAVAIVQMLPQRLWPGSGLGEAMRVNLRATTAGLANAKLTVDEDWFADNLPTGMKMPVVTLEPESLHFWARSLMGKPNAWISGVIFEPSASQQEIISSVKPADKISAEQRLQHFYATASPTAQELAEYLAAAPLTLPVMRLVQRVMLPESRQVHLAEVFLGGLIKRISAQDCNPMVMEYDFHDSVRDLLLDSVLIPDAVDVLKEVSKYLENRLGNPLDFMALLVDPTAIDGVVIDEENRAFAEIVAKVLGRLGGDYGKLAKKIENYLAKEEKLDDKENKINIDFDDEQALEDIRKGGQSGFSFLYEKYARQVYSYLKNKRYLSADSVASTVQETFLKLYENIHKIDTDKTRQYGSILPWLYKVALNTAINIWRKENSKRDITNVDEIEEEYLKINAYDDIKTYENFQNWDFLCNKIEQAIDNMDCKERIRERLRKVFGELKYESLFGGEKLPSKAELAKDLGVSPSTIHKDFNLIRQLLVNILKDEQA